MADYSNQAEYLQELKQRCILPLGFKAASVSTSYIPSERPQGGEKSMNLSLLKLDEATSSFAGVFTRNKFPGAPVILGKERLNQDKIQGVMINNSIANVCAPNGVETAKELCDHLASQYDQDGGLYFSSSTGVIGWSLPSEAMKGSIPKLTAKLERNGFSEESDPGSTLSEVAQGIMTTDSFPKARSAKLGGARIVAVAKGAGMIEPNMATMLCFVMTDADISRDALRRLLPPAVEGSFNTISVDGDQSTSDMVLAFSSGLAGRVNEDEFSAALEKILKELAQDLVRNGEGTGHVISLDVTGAPSDVIAREAGKGVVNSPLVKTAVAGNDPNVGRILSSLGDWAGNNGLDLDPAKVTLTLGGQKIYHSGRFELDRETEDVLADYLKDAQIPPWAQGYPAHQRSVEITLDLGMGLGKCRVFGSDLTHEYVTENADYRT